MIKAIIFDLNGIFIKSELLNKRVEEQWGISRGEFIPALNEIMEIVRRPRAPSSFSLWKPYFNQWELDVSEKEFFRFWFSGEKVSIEMLHFSQELREKNVKIFILSNNFKERTQYYEKHFPELFSSIDKAYFSWGTGFVKPDKQAWLNILKENDLKPSDCLYFDDSEKNVAAAKELGINSYLFKDIEKLKKIVGRSISL